MLSWVEKHRNPRATEGESIYPKQIATVACKWCVPSASDVFLSKNDNSGGKTLRLPRGWNIIFISRNMSCVITCSDFYPLSNQINLLMVINILGIIIILTLLATLYNILVLCCLSHISGVMVSMFASSDVNHKFEHLSGQAKNNKVGFWWLVVAESG